MREVDMYSTVDNAVKMVVANKVDKVLCPWLVCLSLGCKLQTKQAAVCTHCASPQIIQELLPHCYAIGLENAAEMATNWRGPSASK